MTFGEKLAELRACSEARAWVGERTLEKAWVECQRADWMLWLACRVNADRRLLVGAASAIARDVLPLFEAVRSGDNRVRACLDACDRYAAGEEIDLRPYASDAAYAAYAVTYAAYAASDAAYAAYAAARAAADAYAAADAAAAYASARHAEIVRKMISVEQIKKAMEDRHVR